MEKIFTSPVKNYIQRNGFVMVSNLLIEYQQDLKIDDKELSFIIKIMKNNAIFIHDKELDSTVCSKTLSRRRNSLKKKGILNFTVVKQQDPETGIFCTQGISYDLSPLENKLQDISNKLEKKRQKEAEKIIRENKFIVSSSEIEPLNNLIENYQNYYNEIYNPSKLEIDWYNSLNNKEKEIFKYVFDWLVDSKLLGKIKPRLALFIKAKFRFEELKKYCEENGLLDDIINEEAIKIQNKIDEEYYRFYEDKKDNYAFLKAVERIVNRYWQNNSFPEGAKKLIDSSYENTYNLRKRR